MRLAAASTQITSNLQSLHPPAKMESAAEPSVSVVGSRSFVPRLQHALDLHRAKNSSQINTETLFSGTWTNKPSEDFAVPVGA